MRKRGGGVDELVCKVYILGDEGRGLVRELELAGSYWQVLLAV